MKHILTKISVCVLVLLFGMGEYSYSQTIIPQNWDQDIKSLRDFAIPGTQYTLDDYTQYAPAALMLGLKIGGYEGRSDWAQLLVADAFSIASMAAVVNTVKYAVNRTRPNDKSRSFPSGHTATAFMTATMLHKEYGWKSPWWSIGGYTIAAFTGVSRIVNNWHWMSDVAVGAAVGIGSVHLGYYLSDLIFKDRSKNPAYEQPAFYYDPSQKHYVAELLFGRRFILDGPDIYRGGTVGLSTDIPITSAFGVTARASASSFTYTSGVTDGMYGLLAGSYYKNHFAKRFEASAHAMAGCGFYMGECGADIIVGMGLSFFLDENFKIKAFTEYETVSLTPQKPWLQSFVLGWSSAWSF